MRYTTFTLAAAIVAVHAQNACQDAYKACVAAGTPDIACSCTLTACLGEDDLRNREYCSSATANLPTSTSSSSSSSSSSASVITGTAGSQPPGQTAITAAEGSLQLGETCSDSKQCANGADCYGTTSFTIRRCGNFNAECTTDSQCAYNTCSNGLCSGFLASSAYLANTVSQTSAPASSSAPTSTGYSWSTSTASEYASSSSTSVGYACNPAHEYPEGQQCVYTNGGLTLVSASTTAAGAASSATAPSVPTYGAGVVPAYGAGNGTTGVAATGTGATVPSHTAIVPYTGAASVAGVCSGVMAVAAGALAFVL
ncbi:Hypothetical predicted protein [Lecanosticta acicola]|uniref:Uncharacterized protein n=1 Tax=Lecanosticta acicola TaxID=111012 RepID=A0AAI8YY97_9PEZI|nr:Hypothetical predicted protein [Lecanosticta acicola]